MNTSRATKLIDRVVNTINVLALMSLIAIPVAVITVRTNEAAIKNNGCADSRHTTTNTANKCDSVKTACYKDESKSDIDAYVLVNPNRATASWKYTQLKMSNCAWCGRSVDMNRHHIVPQAANPSLRDVKENLIVLCRDCHFVIGHRCDWKQYNPDSLYICTHFTNCIKSADMRNLIDGTNTDMSSGADTDSRNIIHVTNDVPESQRPALERILTWKE